MQSNQNKKKKEIKKKMIEKELKLQKDYFEFEGDTKLNMNQDE